MDRDFLIDLFSDFGPVTIRRMFSGFGISADGINFALALRAGLYLRADEATIPQFQAEGSKPSVSAEKDGEGHHGQFVLGIAGAVVRRFRRIDWLGKGRIGGRATRCVDEIPQRSKKGQGARRQKDSQEVCVRGEARECKAGHKQKSPGKAALEPFRF
jgi:TfoX N-terminal domain